MKDIYELLNEADIDFSDVKDMKVDELERKRGKKKLMNSIKSRKRKKKKTAITAASLAIVALISGTMINPTWAADVPIIGDIFQKIFINNNPEFKNYINVIGKTSSYEGVDITFENAVADNNSLMISYVVKDNNKPIPFYVDVLSPTMEIKVNGESMNMSGGAYGEKIDDNTVRILRTVDWNFEKLPNKLNIEISDTEQNMDIKFSMDTKEIENNTKTQKVNKELNIDGQKWMVEDITISPIKTKVKYYVEEEKEDKKHSWYSFLIFDQDGNEVKFTDGESSMNGSDDYVEGRSDYTCNYITTKDLRQLTFIPRKHNHESSSKIVTGKIDIENFEQKSLKVSDNISLVIEDAKVYGDKLAVKYCFYYKGKKATGLDGAEFLVNGQKPLKLDMEEVQQYSSDCEDSCVNFYEIHGDEEIEIQYFDTITKNLFEDQAFTIDIK